MRHGLRSPLAAWKNSTNSYNCPREMYQSVNSRFEISNMTISVIKDLYNDLYNSTCFTGELMQEGFDQEKSNGDILKQMYPDATIQKIRSTDLTRTKMSAQGMYQQILNDDQIIHVGSADFDYIVRPSNCSFDLANRQYIIQTQNYNLTAVQQLQNETGNYDFTYEDFCDAYRVNNILNYTTNASDEQLQYMCYLLDDTYKQTSWNESQINIEMTQKINVGPFSNELLGLMDNTIQQDKIYIFSGHDVSISPISGYFLQLEDKYQGQPDFASMMIIEIDNDQQTVQFYYKGNHTDTQVQQVKSKVCNDYECSLDAFTEYLQAIKIYATKIYNSEFFALIKQQTKQQQKVKRTDKNYKTKTAPAIKKSIPCQVDEQNAEQFEQKTVHEIYEKIANHFSWTRNVPWPLVKNFILKYQQQNKPINVLDDGCGNGKYCKLFIQSNNNYAIDYSYNLCQIAKQENPFVNVINADGLNLPFKDNLFDLSISIAVLHHLSTEQRRLKYVQELYRVMNNNGIGIISVWAYEQDTINTSNDRDRFVPWSVNPCDQKRFHEENIQEMKTIIHNRYYHFFVKNELAQLLKQAGFKILKEEGKQLYEEIYDKTELDDEYLDHDNWYCVFQK